jgi:16S rRNA (uracil1498-N3)-methyltransferase
MKVSLRITACMLRIGGVKQPAARIPRFHVPVTPLPGVEIELSAWAARHCAVLRLRRGDAVVVFDGAGGEFAAELTLVSEDGTRARVLSGRAVERESPLGITLAQCISGGDRMDLTLQKSTELGVARIVPIASERSIVKLSRDRADRRVAHWRKIVIAACEQCGRNRIPEVAGIIELDTFLSEPLGGALRLLLAPDAEGGLKRLDPPESVILLVGPEGGLAPHERRHAESRGFLPVRFGPRTLRTETAPIAVVAAMQGLWGDC